MEPFSALLALCAGNSPVTGVELTWKWQHFSIFLASKSVQKELTHWGRDKMDAISQTPFSSEFSWMKMFDFRSKFHWFVPKGLINNIPAFVQIMAWRRPGDKPLSEPMMVILSTHICVTRPQWVKTPHGCADVRVSTNRAGCIETMDIAFNLRHYN